MIVSGSLIEIFLISMVTVYFPLSKDCINNEVFPV